MKHSPYVANPECCSDPRYLCNKCKAVVNSNMQGYLKRSTLNPTHATRNKLEPLVIPTLNFGQESPPKSKPGEPLLLPRMDWTQKG